jgi:hypothetical protein
MRSRQGGTAFIAAHASTQSYLRTAATRPDAKR